MYIVHTHTYVHDICIPYTIIYTIKYNKKYVKLSVSKGISRKCAFEGSVDFRRTCLLNKVFL